MLKVALVGKPNVGKSSLFNLFAKERIAITSEIAGTTRDFKKSIITLGEEDNKHEIELIDTGGIEDRDEMFDIIKKNSLKVAKNADVILFIVDGKEIPTVEDKKIFYELQKANPNIALVINKIDNDKELERAWEFDEFGVKEFYPISVSHNRGTIKLRNFILSHIEKEQVVEIENSEDDDFNEYLENFDETGELLKEEKEPTNEIKVAIIGRPNVGKSSILNALVGQERSVVSPIAGTTVDPVDETIEYKDKQITFVDTAGIRRRGKIEGIEKFALNRTQSMLEGTDIAILVLDASESFKDLDEKIAGLVDKFRLGVIIIFNKWDKVHTTYEKIVEEFRYKFKFLHFAPIMTISATTHRNVEKLKDKILQIHESYSQRIPTSTLNEVIKEATIKHPLPSDNGKVVRIYFATQFDTKPPRIALVMNRPKSLHFSYKRYLLNSLREKFNFEGVQIDIFPRKKGERTEDSELED